METFGVQLHVSYWRVDGNQSRSPSWGKSPGVLHPRFNWFLTSQDYILRAHHQPDPPILTDRNNESEGSLRRNLEDDVCVLFLRWLSQFYSPPGVFRTHIWTDCNVRPLDCGRYDNTSRTKASMLRTCTKGSFVVKTPTRRLCARRSRHLRLLLRCDAFLSLRTVTVVPT